MEILNASTRLFWTLWFSSCIGYTAPLLAWNLPNLGTDSRGVETPAGAAPTHDTRHALSQAGLLWEEPRLTYPLQTWSAAWGSGLFATPPHILVIRDPHWNAWASGDGYIGIHTGLLSALERVEALAAVMAHEMAHVHLNHLNRQQALLESVQWPAAAALLGSALVGAYYPQLAAGMWSLSEGAVQHQLVQFSRSHEAEADRIAIQWLHERRWDPTGMWEVLLHLSRLQRINGAHIPGFLRTHPLESARLSDTKDRLAQLQPVPAQDPVFFQLFLCNLQGLLFPADKKRAHRATIGQHPTVSAYAQAWQHFRNQHYETAIHCLQQLPETVQRAHWEIADFIVRAYLVQKAYSKAWWVWEKAVQVHGLIPPLADCGGQLAAADPTHRSEALLAVLHWIGQQKKPGYLTLRQHMGRWAMAQQRTADALLLQSDSLYWEEADPRKARLFLERAIRTASVSSYDVARMRAKLAAF